MFFFNLMIAIFGYKLVVLLMYYRVFVNCDHGIFGFDNICQTNFKILSDFEYKVSIV